MERSDKQIAAEFDAYCAAAKANRRFNETTALFWGFDALPETYRESLGFNDLRNAKLIPIARRDFRIPLALKKTD